MQRIISIRLKSNVDDLSNLIDAGQLPIRADWHMIRSEKGSKDETPIYTFPNLLPTGSLDVCLCRASYARPHGSTYVNAHACRADGCSGRCWKQATLVWYFSH